jgi:hypothetical protein
MPINNTKCDKKTESLLALKNANKHLADLFDEMAKKDHVLSAQSSQISYVAKQCGDLQVSVYVGAERKTLSLKMFLEAAAANLNEARS